MPQDPRDQTPPLASEDRAAGPTSPAPSSDLLWVVGDRVIFLHRTVEDRPLWLPATIIHVIRPQMPPCRRCRDATSIMFARDNRAIFAHLCDRCWIHQHSPGTADHYQNSMVSTFEIHCQDLEHPRRLVYSGRLRRPSEFLRDATGAWRPRAEIEREQIEREQIERGQIEREQIAALGITELQCYVRWIDDRARVEAGCATVWALTPVQVAAAKQRHTIAVSGDPDRLRALTREAAERSRLQVRVDLEFEDWE